MLWFVITRRSSRPHDGVHTYYNNNGNIFSTAERFLSRGHCLYSFFIFITFSRFPFVEAALSFFLVHSVCQAQRGKFLEREYFFLDYDFFGSIIEELTICILTLI